MSYNNFLIDLDKILNSTDNKGFLEVSSPSSELHNAILEKGYRVVCELSNFTVYKLRK